MNSAPDGDVVAFVGSPAAVAASVHALLVARAAHGEGKEAPEQPPGLAVPVRSDVLPLAHGVFPVPGPAPYTGTPRAGGGGEPRACCQPAEREPRAGGAPRRCAQPPQVPLAESAPARPSGREGAGGDTCGGATPATEACGARAVPRGVGSCAANPGAAAAPGAAPEGTWGGLRGAQRGPRAASARGFPGDASAGCCEAPGGWRERRAASAAAQPGRSGAAQAAEAEAEGGAQGPGAAEAQGGAQRRGGRRDGGAACCSGARGRAGSAGPLGGRAPPGGSRGLRRAAGAPGSHHGGPAVATAPLDASGAAAGLEGDGGGALTYELTPGRATQRTPSPWATASPLVGERVSEPGLLQREGAGTAPFCGAAGAGGTETTPPRRTRPLGVTFTPPPLRMGGGAYDLPSAAGASSSASPSAVSGKALAPGTEVWDELPEAAQLPRPPEHGGWLAAAAAWADDYDDEYELDELLSIEELGTGPHLPPGDVWAGYERQSALYEGAGYEFTATSAASSTRTRRSCPTFRT